MSDLLAALTPVVRTLDALAVTYYVGGSLASSAHGVARASLDVDLIAALEPVHIAPFVAALQGAYYLDSSRIEASVRERLLRGSSAGPAQCVGCVGTRSRLAVPRHDKEATMKFPPAFRCAPLLMTLAAAPLAAQTPAPAPTRPPTTASTAGACTSRTAA